MSLTARGSYSTASCMDLLRLWGRSGLLASPSDAHAGAKAVQIYHWIDLHLYSYEGLEGKSFRTFYEEFDKNLCNLQILYTPSLPEISRTSAEQASMRQTQISLSMRTQGTSIFPPLKHPPNTHQPYSGAFNCQTSSQLDFLESMMA